MLIAIIFLVSDSIATQSQMYSEPTLSWVSSTINSETLFLLKNNLFGLYFCIQSLIAVWLLWTNRDIALDVILKERPLK